MKKSDLNTRTERIPFFFILALGAATSFAASNPAVLYPDRMLERMPFNNPGVGEAGVGFLAHAVVYDPDGDGDWDLCAGGAGYSGGEVFYENVGPKDGAPSVLKKGVKKFLVGNRRFALRDDGGYTLTSADSVSYSGADHKPGAFRSLNVGTNNVHWGRVRCNSWRTKDFDGDGRDDVIVGIGDWHDYGWDNAYDGERQAWMHGRCRGLVYLLRNLGEENGKTKWSEPRLVRIENGEPIETMGNPHPMLEDFDGDGDLDFILSDFPGSYTYFENIGTRKNPVYTSGRLLHDSTGKVLAADECIPVPQAVDWDRDGKLDIVAAEEDSRISFYRNTGRFWKGMPVFDPPAFIKCEREYLRFGILVSPFVCDYDGDGDQDIVVGDAAGYLAWFENLSGPKCASPKWEGPHYISCAAPTDAYRDITVRPDTFQNAPFKHKAGHNGSIQGPVEAVFGYTCESVADWDGDGDLDIMYNTTWGKPMLLENIGTRTQPRYAAPHGIEVEWGEKGQPRMAWEWLTPERTGNPKEIVTQWRTTPLMYDMNGDGLMDLVLADVEGYLALFERYRAPDGSLRLKAPRRAFLDAANGRPMGVTGWGEGNGGGKGGNSGRRKIVLADWDGDGKVDLIMNGRNVVLWTQENSANGTWSFRRRGEVTDQRLSGHSVCPAVADFDGDGIVDLVAGVEDGFIYMMRNPRADGIGLPLGVNLDFEQNANGAPWNLPKGWSVAAKAGRKGSRALRWKNDDKNFYAFAIQNLILEPGCAYRFGGWVKVVKNDGKTRPEISIDWSDRNGKWMSASYAHAVVDNDPHTEGWTRFEGTTRLMPSTVATGKLLAILPRGMTGEVLFDDFSIVPVTATPIEYIQCSAYQDAFTPNDGPIRFVAALHLNTVKHPFADYAAELSYTGGDGRAKSVKIAKLTPETADVTLDAKSFSLGEQDVTLRILCAGKEVGKAVCRVTCRAEALKRRVSIDKYGRTLFEGQPFFPMGMYTGRMSDEDLAIWKATPFNFAMQYGAITEKDLDRWQLVHTYAATDVRSLIYGYNYSAKSRFVKPEQSERAVKDIVARVGKHPALFAWYLVDEAPLALVPNIATVKGFFHKYDPDHPTYAVTDKPDDPHVLLPCFDVLGMDPYPIGNHGGRADISICAGWVETARAGIFDIRPQWHVPQTFNWGWYRKEELAWPNVYMPRREEIANMTWQGLAAGANGLCAYAFHSIRKNLKGADFDRAWGDVCSVAREVKSVESILLSVPENLIKVGTDSKDLVIRAYRHEGKDYLLIVSRRAKPVQAVIRLPRACGNVATVLGGGVSAKGNTLAVDFPALGYALVTL